MIGMDMREDEDIDASVIDADLVERYQRRGTELDGIAQPFDIDDKTGIEAAAGAEGVAAAGEGTFADMVAPC
jgi:hypothetical protein